MNVRAQTFPHCFPTLTAARCSARSDEAICRHGRGRGTRKAAGGLRMDRYAALPRCAGSRLRPLLVAPGREVLMHRAGRTTESWAARDKCGNRPYSTVCGICQVFRRDSTRQVLRQSSRAERLFRDAGIGPGMKVLDLGSGAGNVALLGGAGDECAAFFGGARNRDSERGPTRNTRGTTPQ